MEVGREMEGLGLPRSIVLPVPVFLKAPYAGTLRPGMEALELGTLATVVQTFQFPSSPAAGAASSSAPAMLDGTASGQDAGTGEAPVPDINTASGEDAAPRPERETASGQDAAPRPERGTASDQDAAPRPEGDTASDQDAPPHSDRGTASGQVAPAQDEDVQAAAPETEECFYWKDKCWWKDRGREQRQRCANWQSPWSGTWSGASWSARGNWQEGRWDSSMDE